MKTQLRVMILEDEPPASAQLEAALRAYAGAVEIVGRSETTRDAERLLAREAPDLLFADVHLADGSVMRLFERIVVPCPVVFVTAYDTYWLEAFERNAIDYLLKPIDPARVAAALDKYHRLDAHFRRPSLADLVAPREGSAQATAARGAAAQGAARARVVARSGADLVAIPVQRIAWITSEQKLTVLVERSGARYLLDETLAELEASLDPSLFFRANRQFLIHADAIVRFRPAGKGRIALTLEPASGDDVLVSQERGAAFRAWIEGKR